MWKKPKSHMLFVGAYDIHLYNVRYFYLLNILSINNKNKYY